MVVEEYYSEEELEKLKRKNKKKKKKSKNKKMKKKKKSSGEVISGEYGLVTYEELPEYMKENEFIRAHYRSEWPLPNAFLSFFSWHNETINIWTHMIGFFVFLGFTLLHLGQLALVADFLFRLPWSISSSGVNNVSLNHAFFFRVLPPLPRQDQPGSSPAGAGAARWPFLVFLAGSMFCLLSSSLCHLLCCHSCRLNVLLSRLDYAGIAVMIVSSFFPPPPPHLLHIPVHPRLPARLPRRHILLRPPHRLRPLLPGALPGELPLLPRRALPRHGILRPRARRPRHRRQLDRPAPRPHPHPRLRGGDGRLLHRRRSVLRHPRAGEVEAGGVRPGRTQPPDISPARHRRRAGALRRRARLPRLSRRHPLQHQLSSADRP